MTILEARQIAEEYEWQSNPTEEERFRYTEALDYLIREAKDSRAMMALGGMYYEERNFELARKYYEMAAEYDNPNAAICLGYIWYYGRTGVRDYEKAFHYYDQARRLGSPVAAYKVADMYKNGYYVQKDLARYQQIIEELYQRLKDSRWPDDPVPEVFTRLAAIRAGEGNKREALRLYRTARQVLARRIQNNAFFGNLNIMKWMIEDIYRLKPLDEERIRLYDLYELLKKPVKVTFELAGESHEVEAVAEEDSGVVIRFDEKWYRTVDDFFQKAELDGEHLTSLYDELGHFEVKR